MIDMPLALQYGGLGLAAMTLLSMLGVLVWLVKTFLAHMAKARQEYLLEGQENRKVIARHNETSVELLTLVRRLNGGGR
jgi:hypothetical protein